MNNLEPNSWVDNYADYLYRYAQSRVNDSAVAEDLVQETFLSAWKARERFEGRSSEKTWLSSILKNKIIDYYRKALVKDANIVTKHTKPSAQNTEGGIVKEEAYLDISNVMLWDEKAGEGARVGIQYQDGKKVRNA